MSDTVSKNDFQHVLDTLINVLRVDGAIGSGIFTANQVCEAAVKHVNTEKAKVASIASVMGMIPKANLSGPVALAKKPSGDETPETEPVAEETSDAEEETPEG